MNPKTGLHTQSGLPSLIQHNLRLEIEYRVTAELRMSDRKLKNHSSDTIEKIMASITALGFCGVILTDNDDMVIDGHALLEAARRLGMPHVPTVRIGHLSNHQLRLLRLTLNHLATQSTWNEKALKQELQELMIIDDEISLDVIGMSFAEIDAKSQDCVEEDAPEALPEPIQPEQSVARIGDEFELGVHKILCGDSQRQDSFQSLMGNDRAHMAMKNPPFNIPISGNVSGHGKKVHKDFVQGSGELTKAAFQEFLTTSMTLHSAFCVDGALVYAWMDWKHGGEMYQAMEASNLTPVALAIWVKTHGGNSAFYRPQHELCFIAKVGTAPYRNNVQMGKFGRTRSNCWQFPGMNSFGKDRDELLAMHPTVKNLDMICEAIRDTTNRGDIVLDGFLGSGTTLIAAERTGRICRGIELDPLYVDCIIRRWEKMTGREARLANGGPTFAELAVQRLVAPVPAEAVLTRTSSEVVPTPRVRIRPVFA